MLLPLLRWIAVLQIGILVFGQLGLNAFTYFTGIFGPAWLLWGTLYCSTFLLVIADYKKIRPTQIDFLFLAFFFLIVLSFLVFGESPDREFFFRYAGFVVGPFLIGRVWGTQITSLLFRSIPYFGWLYVSFLVFTWMTTPELIFDTDRLRLFPIGGPRPDLGLSTGPMLGTTFGAWWIAIFIQLRDRSNTFKTCTRFLLAIGLLPILLFMVSSRAAPMSLLILFFLGALLMSKISFKLLMSLIIGLAVAILCFCLLPAEKQQFLSEFSLLGRIWDGWIFQHSCDLENSSFTARITLIAEALRLFAQKPFFGIGTGNFGYRFCGTSEGFASPHTTLLQVLCETGIFGFTIFVLPLYRIIKTGLQGLSTGILSREECGMFLIWVFFLIYGQFSGDIFYDYPFFILTGLLAGCFQDFFLEP